MVLCSINWAGVAGGGLGEGLREFLLIHLDVG